MASRSTSRSLARRAVIGGTAALASLALWAVPAGAQTQTASPPPPGLLASLGLNLPIDITTNPLGVHVILPLGGGGLRADLVLGPPAAAPAAAAPAAVDPAAGPAPKPATAPSPGPAATPAPVVVSTPTPVTPVVASAPELAAPVVASPAPGPDPIPSITDSAPAPNDLPVVPPTAPPTTARTVTPPTTLAPGLEVAIGPPAEADEVAGLTALSLVAASLILTDGAVLGALVLGLLGRRRKA